MRVRTPDPQGGLGRRMRQDRRGPVRGGTSQRAGRRGVHVGQLVAERDRYARREHTGDCSGAELTPARHRIPLRRAAGGSRRCHRFTARFALPGFLGPDLPLRSAAQSVAAAGPRCGVTLCAGSRPR